jgi:hypothetical protein
MTNEQFEILYRARALAPRGQVLTNDAYPAAHELAEDGWLRREFVDGELAWFWTDEAEVALHLGALMDSVQGRQN